MSGFELLKEKSLIYVEDEPITRKVVVMMLQRFVKEIDTASNGKEGLDKINENNYDIIITDLGMPVMDGFSMIDHVRNSNNNTPIVVVTAFRKESRKVEDLVDTIIEKPVDKEILFKALEKILSNSSVN